MEELAVQKKQITDTTKQYIVIKLDNELFGIDIMYIDNIVRMQRITRVPKCQDFYKGVINLRGEIVPVIIKPELQAMVGVQVDMVKEVVTLDEDAIEKNNVGLSDNGQLFISAVGKYNGELISILNLQAIVADKEQL